MWFNQERANSRERRALVSFWPPTRMRSVCLALHAGGYQPRCPHSRRVGGHPGGPKGPAGIGSGPAHSHGSRRSVVLLSWGHTRPVVVGRQSGRAPPPLLCVFLFSSHMENILPEHHRIKSVISQTKAKASARPVLSAAWPCPVPCSRSATERPREGERARERTPASQRANQPLCDHPCNNVFNALDAGGIEARPNRA